MKKIKFVLFSIFFAFVCNAQTEKGTKFFGGNLNLSLKSNNNTAVTFSEFDLTKQNSFEINTEFGYFFSNNNAIGLEVGYKGSQDKRLFQDFNNSQPGGYETFEGLFDTKIYSVAAFSKNFVPIIDKLNFFLISEIGFGSGKIEQQYSNNSIFPDRKISLFGISTSPGLVYFITPKLSFQTTFGQLKYTSTKITQENVNDIKIKDFGLSLDSSTLLLGLNYYFK